MGYLNDTTMIASSKQDLEQMLTIADSFYKLNNIKINKMKSILITNSSLVIDNKVSIMYCPNLLSIDITPSSESIRFLGIYFNLNGSQKFTFNKLLSITSLAVAKMKRKLITYEHVQYIINRV